MKKYQIKVKGLQLEIIQDDDNNFIIPDYIKQQEQFGTALKPSFEPIIVARKPFKGSLVDNVIEYGVGGINIDECRVENNNNEKLTRKLYDNPSWKNSSIAGQGSIDDTADRLGRFPANTILTYDETDFDEVCGGFPYVKSGSGNGVPYFANKEYHNKETSMFNGDKPKSASYYNDSGSASRYFMNCKYTGKDEDFRRYIYTPKASKKDRNEGLDEFEDGNITDGRKAISDSPYLRKETPRKNTHPTVKPTLLMQYLVRLVTPKGGTILDPFMGSGSTGKAVMFENKERKADYNFIGIEKEKDYCNIAEARIRWAEEYKEKKENENQISFEDLEAKDEI